MESRNVVLVGFMGTGKSSVGKILADRLKRPLTDIDRMIEEKEKRKIREIFEKDGEAYFRLVEKELLRAAAQKLGQVITTGGGAVIDPENRRALKETGVLVALSATPETIYERVKNSRQRPLLQGGDLLSEIRRLLEGRRPFYAEADLFFDTDGKNAAQVAGLVLEALKEKL